MMNRTPHDRILRHWGALAAVFLFVIGIAPAHADAIYKCRTARGEIAYQDRACANVAEETRIEIAPAPIATIATAPDRAERTSARPPRGNAGTTAPRRQRGPQHAMSYECRAANGEVFYRHSHCPATIAVSATNAATARTRKHPRGARGAATQRIAVSARPITRADACKRLASAGSIGRAAREYDETISTYERNAGRDPCRDR